MGQSVNKKPVRVWGVPLMPYTFAEAIQRIDEMVQEKQIGYVITANLHYAMLSDRSAELKAINDAAAFILVDGMPMLWASRMQLTPLPERVAGADLVWKLCEHAAKQGYRLYFYGGAPGVAAEAALKLETLYPGIVVAGTYSPPYRDITDDEEAAIIEQIRGAKPDVLVILLGQPKGELWMARNYVKIGAPVTIQLGASIDFVAGKVRRAPRWIQRIGMEWAFRLSQEPKRLFGRYFRNGLFLMRMLLLHTWPKRQKE